MIFTQDIDNFILNLLPPDKRTTTHQAFAQAQASPVQYDLNLLDDYEGGSEYVVYDPTHTYSIGDRTIYLFSVYESLTNGNISHAPNNSATNWLMVNEWFIGSDERIHYTGAQKLAFEYALNRYFRTIFRQPNAAGTSISDIFIGLDESPNGSFLVGAVEGNSSAVYDVNSQYWVFTTYVLPFESTYSFIIYVPLTVFNAIPGGEKTIRLIADKYVLTPITYKVQTY
jgi:hypothetical protein